MVVLYEKLGMAKFPMWNLGYRPVVRCVGFSESYPSDPHGKCEMPNVSSSACVYVCGKVLPPIIPDHLPNREEDANGRG